MKYAVACKVQSADRRPVCISPEGTEVMFKLTVPQAQSLARLLKEHDL
jgi:hypothetical protein